jgi:hypothetical protein
VTPTEAATTVKELMRLPGSSAACVYDLATERAIASRGARGMRTRQQARLARWAFDSALSVTLRASGPGEVRELTIAREEQLHTLSILTPPDGKASLLHLVSDPATADTHAIRAALDRIRTEVSRRALAGTRRTPGATWPQGRPPAVSPTLLPRPGAGVPAPERDTGLLDRVLASLRSDAGARVPVPSPSRTVRARARGETQ